MSLTEQLKISGSPLGAYIDGVSPWLSDSRASGATAREAKRVLGLTGLSKAELVVPPSEGIDAARLGTALDYRARIALGGFDPLESVALKGISDLRHHEDEVDGFTHKARVLSEVFDVAVELLGTTNDEHEIDRACFLLAHCEQVYRAGAGPLNGSLGRALDEAASGVAFSRCIDSASLDELRTLMNANIGQLEQWSEMIASGHRLNSNPEFIGSDLVGGADADWMVGDTLIDCKTYVKLTPGTLRQFLRQLLGYVVLDLDDSLGIRNVGIWLPKQGRTRTWSLSLLLGGDPEELLPRLRSGVESALNTKQLAAPQRATGRRKRQLVADNKNTDQEKLEALAQSAEVDLRFRVGRNGSTSETILRGLATDKYAKVREGVARNESAPTDVLTALALDRSKTVRDAVARNPTTPLDLKKLLARGTTPQLQRIENTPTGQLIEVQSKLGKSPATKTVRLDDSVATPWFAEFLGAALRAQEGGKSIVLPTPSGNRYGGWPWQTTLSTTDWLQTELPGAVKYDLMREDRPSWVRRQVASSLPVQDPVIRDWLLADSDPAVRWRTLQRTADVRDESLSPLLSALASDRKAREHFRKDTGTNATLESSAVSSNFHVETLLLVALHPSTPQADLEMLAGNKSPAVLAGLLENPALGAEYKASLIPRLKTMRDIEVRERLAGSEKLPSAAMQVIAGDKNPAVRERLARNISTPVEILEALAQDPFKQVRLAAAANPSTPAVTAESVFSSLLVDKSDFDLNEALSLLRNRDDLEISHQLVANAIERLSKSRQGDGELRRASAGDERADATTLRRLSRSADVLVRCAVAKNPSAPEIVVRDLASDSDPTVRSAVATRDDLDSNLLEKLACDPEPEVRARVAANRKVSPSVLMELLADQDRKVGISAYRNDSTPEHYKVEFAAQMEREWRESAPSRKDLEEMVASTRAETRLCAASDTRTPPDILLMLAGERRSVRVRRAAAGNPSASDTVLRSLAEDQDAEVRQAVAFNPSTPDDVLHGLAQRSMDLAALVALNPGAKDNLLAELESDSDSLVGYIASKTRSARAMLASGPTHSGIIEILP